MGLNIDNIVNYVISNHTVEFMRENDYATRSKEEAQNIFQFLNNKDLQTKRQEELAAYLKGMKDENGNDRFTCDEAIAAAKQQLANENSQKRAQLTQVFSRS